MDGGVLLVSLVIVALAAPVVWVAWWAIASVGDRRVYAGPVPRRPKLAAHGAYPVPADLRLPVRPGKVTIFSLSGVEVGTCHGPDAAGKCPRMLDDGTVECSGRLLTLPRRIRGSFEWQIPSGYENCLLGSYEVFRQARS